MKKKWVSMILALTCLCSCLPLSACDAFFKPDVSVKSVLADAVMDISSAKNLAIVKRSSLTENASANAKMSEPLEDENAFMDDKENKKEELVLAKVEDEFIEEITLKEKDTDEFVKQDALGLEVYKMKVVGDFTFVAYISSDVRKKCTTVEYKFHWNGYSVNDILMEGIGPFSTTVNHIYLYAYGYWGNYIDRGKLFRYLSLPSMSSGLSVILDRTKGVPENFDETGYCSCEYMQSYVIYNKTGKMYSLSQFEVFDICDNTIKTKGTSKYNYYNFKVDENDNLILEDILPNKQVNVYRIKTDIYGWQYVANDKISLVDKEKKIIYYTEYSNYLARDCEYLFDKNGYAYKMESGVVNDSEIYSYNLPKKRMVDGEEEGIDLSTATIYGKDWFVKDGIYWANGGGLYDVSATVNGYYGESFYFLDENFEWAAFYSHNALYAQKMDWKKIRIEHGVKLDETASPILLDSTSVTYYILQNYEVIPIQAFTQIGINGTEYYTLQLNKESGELELNLLTSSEYYSDYLVIEPLN